MVYGLLFLSVCCRSPPRCCITTRRNIAAVLSPRRRGVTPRCVRVPAVTPPPFCPPVSRVTARWAGPGPLASATALLPPALCRHGNPRNEEPKRGTLSEEP